MYWLSSIIIVLAATASVSNAINTSDKDMECIDGLYIVVARATNELPGPGESGRIANRVADRIPGSKVVGLDYPAQFIEPLYPDSQRIGQEALKAVLEDYVDKCPKGKFAVIGYSQGAQVTEDIICGTSGGFFSMVEPIDLKIAQSNLIAGIFFGDPTHVKGSNFSVGTAQHSGLWNRKSSSVDRCESLSDRIRSYCDKGDAFCDRGSTVDKDVHRVYVKVYGDEVVDYIAQRWKNVTGSSPRQESAESIKRWGGPNSSTYNGSNQNPDGKTGGGDSEHDSNNTSTNNGEGENPDAEEGAAASLRPIAGLTHVGLPLFLLCLYHILH
ncbi:unnamed protein product [Clonostachys rosea f. rosea IK726]|uniref:Cutinase n=2 Tax=Bionectria ochroleuca TaxID=29856 RepID=A0A0B7K2G6_BIOOC|nr:unnamed protein product [Clonostachys rosea f. rosea IK726]